MATSTASASNTTGMLEPVPSGFCGCRCGGRTNIAKRFIRGHHVRLPQFCPPRGTRPGTLDRFWSRVKLVDGPLATPCVIWTGPLWPNGYGHVGIRGRTGYAHRLAFEEAVGPIPDGAQVNHRCDQRACIAPNHLFLGNHITNARDAASKGRLWRKLRPANIAEMRHLHRAGWSLPALAKKFGINPSTVKKIVATRTTWHHLTEPDWQPAPLRCRKGHPYDGHRINRLGRRILTCSICPRESRERRLAYFLEYNRTRRRHLPKTVQQVTPDMSAAANPQWAEVA